MDRRVVVGEGMAAGMAAGIRTVVVDNAAVRQGLLRGSFAELLRDPSRTVP